MALAPGLRRRASAAAAYLSVAGSLARLIWRAGPQLTLASAGLAVAGGVLPVLDIVIVSALLEALVEASHLARGGTPRHFVLLLAALAAVSLVTQVIERLTQLVMQLESTRISNQVQLLVAQKAAGVDLSSFEDRAFHNDMRTVSNEAQFRALQVMIQLMSGVTVLASLVSLSVILILWHVWVVAALLAASAATLWVSTHFGSERFEMVVGRAETERIKNYLYNLLVTEQAAKEIRLFGLRDLLVGRFRGLVGALYQQDRRLVVRQLGYSMPAGLMLAVTQVALIVFAAVEALHGVITVGRFNQYMLTIIQLGGQLPMLAAAAGSVHQGNLFAARLFSFLARPQEIESAPATPAAAAWPSGTGLHIVFDHVCFAYPGTDRQVLTDVTFAIRPGQAIALAGSNGSGKSTIVKLLAGLYEPTAGTVSVNGTDVQALDPAVLRAQLSVVFQDFTVYHLSARENVGLGQLRFLEDEERIVAAARRSGLDRVLAGLPDGFDTVLGRFWDKGHELSGGQRQLVALSRALLRQAPVLVLDEPSSALDARAEAEFFGRLLDDARADPARSVIFVSHRLSTARRADHIVVLKEGRIVEQGSHEDLMQACGLYAEMFELQSAAYRSGWDNPSPAWGRAR